MGKRMMSKKLGDVCLGPWPHCIYYISPGGQRIPAESTTVIWSLCSFPPIFKRTEHLNPPYVRGLRVKPGVPERPTTPHRTDHSTSEAYEMEETDVP